MRRLWAMGILSVAAAFLIADCSGGAGATPTSIVTNTPTPRPTPTPTPTSAPTSAPTSTPSTETDVPPISSSTRYVWEITTLDDNGSKPSLAVEPQGTPHIAYMLEDKPGFIKHAVLAPEGWNISTVSTGYFYGPLDIQVDLQGGPQISWHDHDTENQAYAALVDGQWEVHNVRHSGHDGWDGNLAIDSNGMPHTVSIDPSQFGSPSGIEYANFDGTSWSVEEVGSGPIPYEFGTGIALDSQDRPHLVWFDASTQDLIYAIKEGGVWNISTVDSEVDVGRFPSLALDEQDNPSISYYDQISSRQGYFKFARWDGSKWDIQRIDTLDSVFWVSLVPASPAPWSLGPTIDP